MWHCEQFRLACEPRSGKPVVLLEGRGAQVRNLAQVKAGDEVRATFYESLAYEVKKPGTTTPGPSAALGA